MKPELVKAEKILKEGAYTCVLIKGDMVHTCTERGIKPLLRFLNENIDLRGFVAADKVVGKAAAYLYVLLEVEAVYAKVISRSAVETLEKQGVAVYYDEQTDAIRNRTNTGFCPMEMCVMEIESPDEALLAIREMLRELAG